MIGRKSKKELTIKCIKIEWKVGVYCRLSSDDGDKDESNSITNQRDLITNFLKNEKSLRIVDFYADDGYTGTDFNRPEFKRLLSDIKSKKINTVVVKDLSRFGRNYIEVGNYLEKIFPLYNVRFIAVNDIVDSFKDPKSVDNVLISFKNLMNDEYARDISNKVKSSIKTLALNGKFAGGTTPYGYKKDPLDKYHLIIDESEAKIVRLIFKKALNNEGKIKICKYLNNKKILCRKEIQRRKKANLSLNSNEDKIIYRWSTSSIGRMLENETYIGNLVQNKSGNINYKVHKLVSKPKDEWIIIQNTHEAIISKEKFDLVQSLVAAKNSKKRKATNYSIYRGKLKCADCGKAMYRMDDFRDGRNISNYYCMGYKLISNSCSPHKIKASELDNIVLNAIMLQVKLIIDLEKAIIKFKSEKLERNTQEDYEKKVNTIYTEIDRIKKSKKLSYEKMRFKEINKDEYISISKEFDKKIELLEKELSALETIYCDNMMVLKKDDYWIEHFRRNKKIKFLTKDVIDELIENITVDKNGNVITKFKYQDEYREAVDLINSKGEIKYD